MKADKNCMLYLLGTGTPTPTASRFGTAFVLQIDQEFLLFDCGPAATFRLVKAGLWPTQIDYLFLTHHHFDHNADLPCFLLCRWDQSTGREGILNVIGPPPTREIVDKLIGADGAFADDWKARVGAPVSQHVHKNRGGSLPRPVPALNVQNIAPGEVVGTDCWKVSAAQAVHVEPWLQSLAYRVEGDFGSIVFAGDTGLCSSLIDFAKGADVFVANCWNHQHIMDGDGEGPGQTGTLDAALFARDTYAKTLILTHTGPTLCKPGSRERAIDDIAAVYDGNIIFGEEGMKLNLAELAIG